MPVSAAQALGRKVKPTLAEIQRQAEIDARQKSEEIRGALGGVAEDVGQKILKTPFYAGSPASPQSVIDFTKGVFEEPPPPPSGITYRKPGDRSTPEGDWVGGHLLPPATPAETPQDAPSNPFGESAFSVPWADPRRGGYGVGAPPLQGDLPPVDKSLYPAPPVPSQIPDNFEKIYGPERAALEAATPQAPNYSNKDLIMRALVGAAIGAASGGDFGSAFAGGLSGLMRGMDLQTRGQERFQEKQTEYQLRKAGFEGRMATAQEARQEKNLGIADTAAMRGYQQNTAFAEMERKRQEENDKRHYDNRLREYEAQEKARAQAAEASKELQPKLNLADGKYSLQAYNPKTGMLDVRTGYYDMNKKGIDYLEMQDKLRGYMTPEEATATGVKFKDVPPAEQRTWAASNYDVYSQSKDYYNSKILAEATVLDAHGFMPEGALSLPVDQLAPLVNKNRPMGVQSDPNNYDKAVRSTTFEMLNNANRKNPEDADRKARERMGANYNRLPVPVF